LLSALVISIIEQLPGQNFSPSENQLILFLLGDTAVMMRVLTFGNIANLNVLGAESSDIDPTDLLLPLLSRRMFLSMLDTAKPGVGIAAPQVGINRNVFWVQRFDKPDSPFEFFINPAIIKYSTLSHKGKEGCLSMPGERGEICAVTQFLLIISRLTWAGTLSCWRNLPQKFFSMNMTT